MKTSVPQCSHLSTTELDPSTTQQFFTCLPWIAGSCNKETLRALSLVSKSYYKRVRENPVVSFLYKWRPTVSLYRLAVCCRQVGEYYDRIRSADGLPCKLLRWQDELDYDALEHEVIVETEDYSAEEPDEDVILTLEDYLLSDKWEKLDVTRIDTHYCYFLRDEAAERLATLCSRKGNELPPFSDLDYALDQTPLHDMWFRTTTQVERILDHCDLNSNEKMQLMKRGMFSLLTPMKVKWLPIPSYEPLAVQQALGSEKIPRYNNEQEYGDTLVDWWLPLVYQLKNNESAIRIDYEQLGRLPPQVAKRLLLGTNPSYTHLLNMPHDYKLELMTRSEVQSLVCVVSLLKGCCVEVELTRHTTAYKLVTTLMRVYKQGETCEFIKMLYDACDHASRGRIMKELELDNKKAKSSLAVLLCYKVLMEHRLGSITRDLSNMQY